MPTRSHVPKASTALLLTDVINPLDFPGGAAVARRALRMAARLAALRERATRARLPVVYVNDNLGLWRSDIDELVRRCGARGVPGAPVVKLLAPRPADLVVLKATLSGFYQTPLDALLRLAGVRTVIVTGLMADNCVLFTAADAYMRDYRLVIPSDCVTAKTKDATQRAVKTMAELFGARTTPSPRLRLSRQ
jgi:nicotinamidase-related amidase